MKYLFIQKLIQALLGKNTGKKYQAENYIGTQLKHVKFIKEKGTWVFHIYEHGVLKRTIGKTLKGFGHARAYAKSLLSPKQKPVTQVPEGEAIIVKGYLRLFKKHVQYIFHEIESAKQFWNTCINFQPLRMETLAGVRIHHARS